MTTIKSETILVILLTTVIKNDSKYW